MLYRISADAVVLLHAAFIVFVIFGGLLAVWRLRYAGLHLPALAWGVWIEATHGICPLTPLEAALYSRAGGTGFAGDFVEKGLVPLLYPPGLQAEQQVWLAVALAAFNGVLYVLAVLRWWFRRDTPSTH